MAINYSFGLPLKQHFREFIYYQGLLLPHEIDRIQKFWAAEQTIPATVDGDQSIRQDLRKSSVMFIENNPQNDWIYRRMAGAAIKTNNERYWFDLLGFHEQLQLTRYSAGDFFEWHLDFGAGDISVRKLSITVQLSDPNDYEGGDLQFMINQNIIDAPRERGTVIIFPSFILHRVTPITRGKRESIVGWVAGPPYR